MAGFTAGDVPDQRGRTAIVTGANTGIGFEIARALATKGARVLLGCRDAGKADAAMARIAAAVPGADLAFLPLDQADLASVRRAAEVAQAEARLDLLVNNAGVMFPPLTRTAQGHELQFGVNHLGTFALTGLLLGKLAETAGSRVVVTSSLAHRRGRIDWDDIDARRGYNAAGRYGDSKLMNLLHVRELDRRLRAAGSPVTAVACHPGVAATELMRHGNAVARAVWPLVGRFLNTPAMAAWPALQAATDPGVAAGGYYGPQGLWEARGPSGPATRTGQAQDAGLARRLWDLSVELTGVDAC
ncbi:MAG: SDR family NAD(P)-dependent oxidoreductase [Sphingomonadales bacterium]|nr:SDR family NAD(P)-dependent oxidoreductase [Sphingomonadales bacterium]